MVTDGMAVVDHRARREHHDPQREDSRVFVDTFTAALIQLQPLMAVEPGPGLIFFAAVVVFTMLAVESFDPRLIWDSISSQEADSKEVTYA